MTCDRTWIFASSHGTMVPFILFISTLSTTTTPLLSGSVPGSRLAPPAAGPASSLRLAAVGTGGRPLGERPVTVPAHRTRVLARALAQALPDLADAFPGRGRRPRQQARHDLGRALVTLADVERH